MEIANAYTSGATVNISETILPLKKGDVIKFTAISHVATTYTVFGIR